MNQTAVTKPDRTIKIPGVSPWWLPRALSCSRLAVTVLWWKLYLNHHVPFPFRQFAPSWTVCTNPPFSPTTTPCKVTSNLSPTLTDTTYRQWRQPLVTGTLEGLSLEVMHLLRLNWKNKFWWLCPLIASYLRLENLAGWSNLRKSRLRAVFSFLSKRLRL